MLRPWPSGPVWFVWVLLALDLTAFLFYRFTPLLLDPVNRISLSSHSRPAIFFLFLLLATALLYVPARVYFGAGRWFEFGPFSIQASRVLLYPTYFFVGAGVGMSVALWLQRTQLAGPVSRVQSVTSSPSLTHGNAAWTDRSSAH